VIVGAEGCGGAARDHGAHSQHSGGSVVELRSRAPEILFLGARVSHEVKCFSVRQRLISVPISAMS
jgi:hypothetical protein